MSDTNTGDELSQAFAKVYGEKGNAPPPIGDSAPAAPSQMPQPNTVANANDAELANAFSQAYSAKRPVKAAPVVRPFKRATAPSDEPELTLGQSLQQAGHNFVPSAMAAGKSMVGAVTNPSETWNAIKGIGTGLGSQLYGALGGQQDPKEKEDNERLAKALEDHYAQAYGSWKGFKKNLATDPFSTAMDLSIPISGGVGAATKAGLLTGKAAEIAATAARLSNPVNAALAVAKHVVSNPVTRAFQAGATGVPMSLLKAAKVAGESTNPEVRTAFTTFAKGQGDPSEILVTAQNAYGVIRAEKSAKYLAGKGSLANSPVDLDSILKEIQNLRATKLQYAGANVAQFDKANEVLDALEKRVLGYKAAGKISLHDVDILKQSIWDDSYGLPKGSEAHNTVKNIYNATKNAISAVDPKYSKLMESYQEGLSKLKDIQNSLGVGNNATATAAIAKMLRATKTSAKSNLLSELTSKDPKLTAMLAGSAVNPWLRPGMIGQIEGYGVPVLAMTNPSYLPHLASVALASSPRMAGKLNYAAGRIPQALKDVTAPAYLASQAREENAPSEDMTEAPSNTPQAGGLFGRLLGAESSTGQFKNGETVISPKGAIGAAQVMPGTGPEAAALAGEEWSLDRLRNDEAYNKKLGAALLNKLLQDYGGDERKAAAAYNAGPGGVKRAIEVAAAKGGTWEDHIPDETKGYLAKIFRATGGRIGRATGGRIMNHRSEADSLIRLADKTKKALNNSTESLLAVPDEAVTKALSIANEAI